jgi:phosphoribosylformylglycinamidine synthase PurS subunit
MNFRVHVRVIPRPGLLDPQGQAVEQALGSLGFAGVSGVRIGRAIEFGLEAASVEAATQSAQAMCEKLLANPVTEDFVVAVES